MKRIMILTLVLLSFLIVPVFAYVYETPSDNVDLRDYLNVGDTITDLSGTYSKVLTNYDIDNLNAFVDLKNWDWFSIYYDSINGKWAIYGWDTDSTSIAMTDNYLKSEIGCNATGSRNYFTTSTTIDTWGPFTVSSGGSIDSGLGDKYSKSAFITSNTYNSVDELIRTSDLIDEITYYDSWITDWENFLLNNIGMTYQYAYYFKVPLYNPIDDIYIMQYYPLLTRSKGNPDLNYTTGETNFQISTIDTDIKLMLDNGQNIIQPNGTALYSVPDGFEIAETHSDQEPLYLNDGFALYKSYQPSESEYPDIGSSAEQKTELYFLNEDNQSFDSINVSNLENHQMIINLVCAFYIQEGHSVYDSAQSVYDSIDMFYDGATEVSTELVNVWSRDEEGLTRQFFTKRLVIELSDGVNEIATMLSYIENYNVYTFKDIAQINYNTGGTDGIEYDYTFDYDDYLKIDNVGDMLNAPLGFFSKASNDFANAINNQLLNLVPSFLPWEIIAAIIFSISIGVLLFILGRN